MMKNRKIIINRIKYKKTQIKFAQIFKSNLKMRIYKKAIRKQNLTRIRKKKRQSVN